MNYEGIDVITAEDVREYVKSKEYKDRKRISDYIIKRMKEEGKAIWVPSAIARKYGQKKGYNYSKGLNLLPIVEVVKLIKNEPYFKNNVEVEKFVLDYKKWDIEENKIKEENNMNMPFDEVYALMDRMSEIYSIRLAETESKIDELIAKFNEVITKLDAPAIIPENNISDFSPIILKEESSYKEWIKGINRAIELIISIKPELTESEILHSAYNRIRAQYGIVWEQEAKEFKEEYERGPINTRELCWWMESTKKNYKNLLIGKLNTIYSEAKRNKAGN